MKKQFVFLLLAWLYTGLIQAQSDELMQINKKPVSTEEFEKMYTKNLDLVQDPAQKDLDNYQQLFINYKLELEDAYENHYDTLPKIKRELKNYRRDLAKKYLSDEEIIESLTQEAYQRMKKDVHVAHILIQTSFMATAQDTLKAYNKIMKIYKEAQSGKDFFELAKQYSQDPSAKNNNGDLGYINVFHTVYPFESAAYNTPVGEVSKPFRTRFGYHILKVLDKRPAKGEIEVAHIMTFDKKGAKVNPGEDAKTRIFDIYNKLQEGKDSFENLAKKYSDDKSSARHGGKLKKFGIRAMIPEFEQEGFALKNVGDISKPFQTKYGWHIIKLLKKHPVPAYEQIRKEIRNKVTRDERSKMGKEKLLKKIEKMFPVTINGTLDKIYPLIDQKFFENKWLLPAPYFKDDVFMTINNDQKIPYREFLRYLFAHQYRNPDKYAEKEQIIKQLLASFKKEKLFEYYDAHLEEIYPEFANTIQEYKDGLMMFYIKSDKVWDKSMRDSIGLNDFFNRHKNEYKLPKRYKVLLVQVDKKRTAKRIMKYLAKGNDPNKLKEVYDNDNLIVKQKIYNSDDAFVKKHNLAKHQQVMYKDGHQYMVLKLLEILPERLPELSEVRGKVTNDYQQYLEHQWIDELKKKYPVEINRENWNKLREKYKK